MAITGSTHSPNSSSEYCQSKRSATVRLPCQVAAFRPCRRRYARPGEVTSTMGGIALATSIRGASTHTHAASRSPSISTAASRSPGAVHEVFLNSTAVRRGDRRSMMRPISARCSGPDATCGGSCKSTDPIFERSGAITSTNASMTASRSSRDGLRMRPRASASYASSRSGSGSRAGSAACPLIT